jgi:hypothetical protein
MTRANCSLNSRTSAALLLAAFLALPAAARADDVSIELDTAGAFVVKNNGGSIERLRIDEATGNISRNGLLFLHTSGDDSTFLGFMSGTLTTTGSNNSAFGQWALRLLSTGSDNSAFGEFAMGSNITGDKNSGFGQSALANNSTGIQNSAFGMGALNQNNGDHNTAVGAFALNSNTTGNENTAIGLQALSSAALTGSRNVAIGKQAGTVPGIGDDNILIANIGAGFAANPNGQIRIGTTGTHTDTWIAGIDENVVTGSAVFVSSLGELGVAASSLRFKHDVRNMGTASQRLMQLRPVSFRYRPEVGGADGAPTYGLVAEEVAEVAPELVHFDAEGRPFSVHYHLLVPMLLNELQAQQRTLDNQASVIETQRVGMATLAGRLEQLERQLALGGGELPQ